MKSFIYGVLVLMSDWFLTTIRFFAYSTIIAPYGTAFGILLMVFLATTYHWYWHFILWSYLLSFILHVLVPYVRNWNHLGCELLSSIAQSHMEK